MMNVIFSIILLDMIFVVHGWSCVTTPSEVFSRLNTSAVILFDVSDDLNPNGLTFIIRSHNTTAVANARYKNDGTISTQALPGYNISADAAGKVTFTIKHVKDDNKGTYYIGGGGSPTSRCTCLYILDIPSKATVSVSNNPSVGGSATLTCRSTSKTSPSNHTLTFMYYWKVDNVDNPTGSRYAYSSNRNTLTLSQLVKDDVNKQFTCTAKEHITDGYTSGRSDSVTLDIYYGPDDAIISVQSPYTVTEGEQPTDIICSSDCYPGCTYRWTNSTSGAHVGTNGVLSLQTVNRYIAGAYKCTSSNAAAENIKDVDSTLDVVVRYAPDVSLRFSTTNVTEGSKITLFCNGAGVPSTYTYTSLTQTLHGIQIPNRNTAASGTQDHSSIYFPSLHWHDTGTYTCTLNNEIKDINGVLLQTGSIDLYVKVQPKVLDDDLRFAGVTGGTVKIQVPIYSLPVTDKVEITRYDGQPISIKAGKYNISSLDTDVHTNFYETLISLNGKMTRFMIFNLEEIDFGNYTLTIKNEIGVTDVNVFVIAEGPPSKPKGFYFLSDDKSSTFIWEKNFNGGKRQSFVIQTSISGSNNWKNQTEVHEDDTFHKVNDTFYTAVVSLDPGVYTARMFSHNAKGHSEFVELGYTFTVVEKEDNTTQHLPIGGLAGGIAAAAVVFGMVAVVLFTIKRRRKNKDGSTTQLKSSISHGVDDDNNEEEVNTVNPMHVLADEVPPTDNTYAQPIKKKKVVAEHGDLYAMVDKKSKSQPKEGDIYENAPEVAKKKKKKKTSKGKGKAYEKNPYEDPGTTTSNKPRKNVNKDGLIYADMTFDDQPKGQKRLPFHGLDSMTEYVEVDFSKKADPLPDSDEEHRESKN